ncbi:hypothetical protein ACGFIG_26775 [Micromonospora sp. NPDC049048]|uniref:hypothetical protein n=1 Tax=Micromonospora sp. NPDC049048 TaxID=3364263 RepID=UPI0037149CC0
MTQPNDPTEALPAHRQPDDGMATARLDVHRPQPPAAPTAHLPSQDATVNLAAGDSTARLASGEVTARLAAEGQTAHLPSRDATVYLAAGDPTARLASGDATVYLAAGEPTAHLPARDATVYLAAGEPAAPLTHNEATVHLARSEAPVGPAQGEPTMPQRALDGRTETQRALDGRTGPWPAQPAAQDQTIAAGAVGAVPEAGTGRTTGPGPGTLFGGPTGAVAPPGGEVRFGPGVPTTPPPAPAWPAPPPPRRRPVWRTVTSVLSTLLTVALLAAVGLYLWQRISPLEVTGVTVAVPQPAGDRCDVTVDVVATVSTNGRAGEIRYQWLRTGSAPGSLLTERVGRGQHTVQLTLRWAFSGVGTTNETATVNITSPAVVQAQAAVSYDCRRR